MGDQELLRRYALALSLVPDADVAGDLFMDARSDDDLRERAQKWLRKNGFPIPAADPPLPALDADTEAYGLHLARRGRQRRRLKSIMAAGAAVTALVAVFVLGVRVGGRPVNSLARSSVYAAQPIKASDTIDGVRLEVYQAEAIPGTVTLWWALSGPGAGAMPKDLAPRVELAPVSGLTLQGGRVSPSRTQGALPQETETVVLGKDKLLGRSTYKLIAGGRSVNVRVLDWLVPDVLVARKEDPAARTIAVNRVVDGDGFSFAVKSVTVAPTYTLVYYNGVNGIRGAGQVVAVNAEGTALPFVGRDYTRFDETEDLFGPVPAGAGKLQLTFPSHDEFTLPKTVVIPWDHPAIRVLHRSDDGSALSFTVRVPGAVPAVNPGGGLLEDKAKRRYPLTFESTSFDAVGGDFWFTARNLPPGTEPASLTIAYVSHPSPVTMEVELPAK